MYPSRDVGSVLREVTGTPPLADTGSTVNGAAIDRLANDNPLSAVLLAQSGAATGGPSTQTFDAKIEDSEDGSTGWADYTDPQTGAVAAITQQTADDGIEGLSVDLSSAKRYIRVTTTVAFTGGTSPDWPVSTALILGGLEVTQ